MAKDFTLRLPEARVRSAETALDKTTRLAREILDEEAHLRKTKTARLRQSRLDREIDNNVDSEAEISLESEKGHPTNDEDKV